MNEINAPIDSTLTSSDRPTADAISRRAYELWEQDGKPDGADLRHWLQAEQELAGRGAESDTPAQSERALDARQQASDSRPLQGTRAGAAANRDNKRSSRSPFPADRPATATGSATRPGTTAKPDSNSRRRG